MTSLDRELDSNTAGHPECRDVPLIQFGLTAQKFSRLGKQRNSRPRNIAAKKSNTFHKTIQYI